MYTIFYKRSIDYYVIFGICLMAPKSARMRGSAHLKAVTVAHGFSETVTATSLLSNPAFLFGECLGYKPVSKIYHIAVAILTQLYRHRLALLLILHVRDRC